ncbi:STAS domain-containing protein [Nocardia yunnanensis]|nr:STAS domain-containing protein [Nocardia yunnanensis]
MSVLPAVSGPGDTVTSAAAADSEAGARHEGHADGRFLVVVAEGELDITTLPQLRRALAHALATGPGVVVDLRRARFLSLRNACVIADSARTAARRRLGFTVLAGRPEIHRVLAVAGIPTAAADSQSSTGGS